MNLFVKTIFDNEEASGWLPWGVLTPFLAFAMISGGLVIGGSLLRPFGFVDGAHRHIGSMGLSMKLIVCFGLVGLLAILWVKFVEKRSLGSVGLKRDRPIRTFFFGHLIGVSMITAIVLAIWFLGGYEVSATGLALSSPTSLLYVFLLFIGFGIQASAEELIFRGWLLSALTRKFNLMTGIVVSSVLFLLMHFNPENPMFDNVFFVLFSLFACAWVIRSSNIWGVMGWHSGWNWFTASGFDLPVTGIETQTLALVAQLIAVGDRLISGGNTGPEGSVVCIVVLALAVTFVMRKPTANELKLP